ncbi:transglycosylase SLT domain-containing protein [Epibacterium sp. SM1979]|uniref:Transglycosylase SLT domain-containing protein n=2 Tax=Tritonibacter litoralis TaxID=2662264 RepID=A0A843YBF8_9RHOB|nr:transglycosylase SLT domain-containing protein [Tritonibacter litoralis]
MVLVMYGFAAPALALGDPTVAGVCDLAARQAARDQDIPLNVLRAITRTETGRGGKSGLQPWPWTVNMEGAGKWFETEAEAKSYVAAHFKRGARSFDVGCFQINYRWHGHAFESVDQMFDPIVNAQYAARFLRELYDEFGDWSKAAGAYHSRTPTYANKYAARFERVRAGLGPDTAVGTLPTARRRRATFGAPLPLIAVHNPAPLVAQGAVQMGSLVPLQGAANRALIPLN